MTIIIDADACPVIDEVIELTTSDIILVRNFNHFSMKDYPSRVKTIHVDDGFDSADYRIVALAKSGDIVITQDYGLASLLLKKDVRVIHHNGTIYSEHTIDQLLMMRHVSSQMRKAGLKTKGPTKFKQEDRDKFIRAFKKLIT